MILFKYKINNVGSIIIDLKSDKYDTICLFRIIIGLYYLLNLLIVIYIKGYILII